MYIYLVDVDRKRSVSEKCLFLLLLHSIEHIFHITVTQSLFNVSLKILSVLIYFVWLLFDVYLNENMNRNRYYFPVELILESKILVCCILNAYGLSV